MTEQLELLGDPGSPKPGAKPLTDRQQQACDFVKSRDGVTADEVGAHLHSLKERRAHPAAQRCDYCARDGNSVLTSKAVAPLVKYRMDPRRGRIYIVRNPADAVWRPQEPRREPTEAELALNPFAGLDG